MSTDKSEALTLLRVGAGNQDAVFRDGQWEAIEHVVSGRGRLLVVQRTGWGKSFVYFIAAKMLRNKGAGPALLISPLLALMRNQIAAAQRMGVRAETVNSNNQDQWDEVRDRVRANEVDILIISPERLANVRFMSDVLAPVADRISLLVIDEAHCISDWGHDFRPHYRLIERIVRNLPPNLRMLATTATANDRVLDDLRNVLGPNLTVSRGDLHRPSLFLQTIRLSDQAERLAWIAENVPNLPGSGIVYTLTVRDALRVAEWLKSKGLNVESYTGETGDRRPGLETALLENRVKALIATTALGMGFDKPDLGFVIHYQTPGSAVHYYQQVGRAGRAMKAAYGVLLSGAEETEITDFFIERAFPTRDEVNQVIDALAQAPRGLSILQLLPLVNIPKGRIEKTIQLLSLESPAPIVKDGSRWVRTAADLSDSFWERAERLTELRRHEQKQMQDYVGLESGHMEFLIRALDGDPSAIDVPALDPLPTETSPDLVKEAVRFLRRSSLPLYPRKQWPVGGLSANAVSGNISAERRLEEGRVLCVWGDAGWGKLVRQGKYTDGKFDDELVEAVASMIREWRPQPNPTWVTCIPSLRHPNLVPDFAKNLAVKLDLPFAFALQAVKQHPAQKTMANSARQARNLDGVFEPIPESIRKEPVLLVDDMVDSRWTFTIAGYLLRTHGVAAVFPVALASTAQSND